MRLEGGRHRKTSQKDTMGRWPDNTRSPLVTALLIFLLVPLLCALAWWFVRR